MLINEYNPLEMGSFHLVYNNLSPLLEADGRKGISHFLEHMTGSVLAALSRDMHCAGIEYDYCTTHEHVVLSFVGTATAIDEMAPRIVDRVINVDLSTVTEQQFESEKSAVLNEFDQIGADPVSALARNAMITTYGISNPEGERDDVIQYTFDNFKADYDKYLRHPTHIVHVGPRDIELNGVEYADDSFDVNVNAISVPAAKTTSNQPVPEYSTDDFASVAVIGTVPVVGNRDYAALRILIHMLGGDEDSVFHVRLRKEKKLVYQCSATMVELVNTAVPIILTGTVESQLRQTVDAIKDGLADLPSLLRREHFENTKQWMNAKLKEKYIIRFASCGDLLRNGMITEMHDFSSVTYDEMLSVAKKYIGIDKVRFCYI